LGEVNIDAPDESYGALDESNRTRQDKPGPLFHCVCGCALFLSPVTVHLRDTTVVFMQNFISQMISMF